MNWLSTIASAAEVCATLGDPQRARTVHSLLEPHADRMVISARAAHHQGSVAYFLARLATALGDHLAADDLYAEAALRDQRAGADIWVARDLRRHAELLLAHDDTGRGLLLLDRAAITAKAAGLERTVELISTQRDAVRRTGSFPAAIG